MNGGYLQACRNLPDYKSNPQEAGEMLSTATVIVAPLANEIEKPDTWLILLITLMAVSFIIIIN